MKKIILNLAITSFVAMTVTACPSPSTSGNSSASPSPSTGASSTPSTGSGLSSKTKAEFIAFLTCVKTKEPGVAPGIDVQISMINTLTDAQWEQARPNYVLATQGYAALGC